MCGQCFKHHRTFVAFYPCSWFASFIEINIEKHVVSTNENQEGGWTERLYKGPVLGIRDTYNRNMPASNDHSNPVKHLYCHQPHAERVKEPRQQTELNNSSVKRGMMTDSWEKTERERGRETESEQSRKRLGRDKNIYWANSSEFGKVNKDYCVSEQNGSNSEKTWTALPTFTSSNADWFCVPL